MSFARYGIYYTATGDLAARGAAWLGWDCFAGAICAQPKLDGVDLSALTERPRRYGFHATLKAPFALAQGCHEADLIAAAEGFGAGHAAAQAGGLEVTRLGRWLALTLVRPEQGVSELAAQIVETFDPFRAPLSPADLAKRRGRRLTEAQERNLTRWGYPHVFESFRFHMTLSAPSAEVETLKPLAEQHFADVLPRPFLLDAITVVGEDAAGRFHQIARVPLSGCA